jgi:2-isopropylmalate synthase
VEGTLFGNGERTGNVDIVTLALNLFTQGIDPELDLHDVNAIKEVAEFCTQLPVHQRHPYVGELVYTAFSGSHQDAIKKGFEAQEKRNAPLFQVPYLPIDPKDVGRDYEAVIRINSQSGKGGMAYVLRADHGLDLPRSLQVEFSKIAQEVMDRKGKEMTSPELWALFRRTYLLADAPLVLLKQQTVPTGPDNRELSATLRRADGSTLTIEGSGNGPIDAFVDALQRAFGVEFSFLDYHEHAVGRGADATAACYVEIQDADGRILHGVGMDPSILVASLKATLSAVQRLMARDGKR